MVRAEKGGVNMNLTRHLYERQVFDMSNPYAHLTLQDRIIIAAGISNGSSKTAIADTIGKDKSTVGNAYFCFKKRNKAFVYCTCLKTSIKDGIVMCNSIS